LTSHDRLYGLEKLIALRRAAINLDMAFGAAISGFLVVIGYKWIFWVNGIASFGAYFILVRVIISSRVKR
jgi:MFS family permease